MSASLHDSYRSAIALWMCIALVACSIVAGLVVLTLFLIEQREFHQQILVNHFSAIFGLPAAATAAFIIVTLFRQGEEPIKIRGLGFELEGAAGPVVLWVLCFMAMCGGLKLLW